MGMGKSSRKSHSSSEMISEDESGPGEPELNFQGSKLPRRSPRGHTRAKSAFPAEAYPNLAAHNENVMDEDFVLRQPFEELVTTQVWMAILDGITSFWILIFSIIGWILLGLMCFLLFTLIRAVPLLFSCPAGGVGQLLRGLGYCTTDINILKELFQNGYPWQQQGQYQFPA
ncbi:hypothetical protein MMC25_006802 [Agyrium rufum]|nr:hypothetical protein [Agyrium rufum]